MAERPQRHDYSVLSPSLTQDFIANPTDPTVLVFVEQAIQAYVDIFPEYFAGMIYHPQGLGPETPYFFPEEEDYDSLVQATSRIGVQQKYWQIVHISQRDRMIHPLDWQSTMAFALHMLPNGASRIMRYKPTELSLGRLDYAATIRGDKDPKYSTVAPGVNYGGDREFYGPGKIRKIFPMWLKNSLESVTADQLRIDPKDVVMTWESWSNIFTVCNNLYRDALYSSASQNSLVNSLVEKASKEGLGIDTPLKLARHLDNVISKDHVDKALEIIYAEMKDERFDTSSLVTALAVHADNLANMYQQAKDYLGVMYKYE